MPHDEDELQAVRDRIAKKREQAATAVTSQLTAQYDHASELEMAQLLAEEARVDSELANAKANAKVGAVKEGNRSNLKQAKDALLVATGKPVDAPPELLIPGDAAGKESDAPEVVASTGKAGK